MREALKLALEALKQIDAAMPFPVAKLAIKKAEEALAEQDVRDEIDRGAKTLRETYLAQPEPPPECQTEAEKTAFAFGWFKAMEAQRLAQTEQEPAAYIGRTQFERLKDCGLVTTSLTTHKAFQSDVTLYTTPPQRTWVGLDEEDEIDWEEGGSLRDLVEAVEAKLKDKNT